MIHRLAKGRVRPIRHRTDSSDCRIGEQDADATENKISFWKILEL
jgi:hypothetical protein